MNALGRVLSALRGHGCGVRVLGADRARATCPTHRDQRPSLAVTQKEDRVLLRCFAGCPTRTILTALGLGLADLFDGAPPPRTQTDCPRRVVAEFPYSDVLGHVEARKIKFQPKSFAWERRDPSRASGWRRGLQGFAPGLFGVDHAAETKRPFVVEGEKAVLALREIGLDAVAPPIGANLWKLAWSEALWRLGATEAIVVPDNDAAGRTHARHVAASLHAFRPVLPAVAEGDDPWPDVVLQPGDPEAAPLSVKVIDVPGLDRGEDVVDALARGSTRADLLALVERTPRWEPEDAASRRRRLTRDRTQRYRARLKNLCDARTISASGRQPPEDRFPVKTVPTRVTRHSREATA